MKYTFSDLVDILKTLRSEQGCPWDKAQDTRSLLPYLIEETYEYIDAAQKGEKEHMQEELGDVLLQIVFHAQICKEEGAFDIDGVVQGIVEKMIRRHPHVFGSTTAEDADAVHKQWEAIKAKEKNNLKFSDSSMDKVPKGLPPLSRAQELQRRAAKVGFDWHDSKDSIDKVHEEFMEFAKEKQVLSSVSQERLEEEFGDILFSLINYGRHCGLNAATALASANGKFETRFRKMEEISSRKDFKGMEDSALLELWQKAKGC